MTRLRDSEATVETSQAAYEWRAAAPRNITNKTNKTNYNRGASFFGAVYFIFPHEIATDLF
jgi:hypothetical protein